MVWSEQVGVSIVVPSDRVPGDGRNYIVIGQDVPDEIVANFTAALVFRNGTPDVGPTGFDYWALGISKNGSLEVVAYYYADVAGTGKLTYYRQTMLSFSPPLSVTNNPVLQLGYNANYGTYGESAVSIRTGTRDTDGWQSLTLLSPWSIGSEGANYLIRNNVLYYQIHAKWSGAAGGWGNGAAICALPYPPAQSQWPHGDWATSLFECHLAAGDPTLRVSFAANLGGVVISNSYPI